MTADVPPPAGRLRSRALRGSALELIGYGTSQAIRFGGNLILTHLLFPEAFGLTALASIFIQGMMLLSDIGIHQAIVQSPHGEEERFLNTAWTLQVIRGALLCGVTGVVAYPLARLYQQPLLFPVLLVAGLQIFIGGFHSTSLSTLRRRVDLGRVAAIEIGMQVTQLAVTATWAALHPTVWALIGGGVTGVVFQLVATHLLDVGYRNRFAWDAEARRDIVAFGRWIFGSSVVFFISRQTDRLLLGRFMGTAVLGVHSIAVFLSEAMGMVTERITSGVLYPMLSSLGRGDLDQVKRFYYRARLRLDLVGMPALGALTGAGDWVVRLLWDPRYHQAGWMLRVLCVRAAISALLAPCETCLSALGQPRHAFLRSLVKASAVVVGVPLAYQQAGIVGLIWATVLAELLSVAVVWPPFARLGLLRPMRELLAVALYVAGLLIGVGFRALVP